MTETGVERKLTTVLSADVAGYGRLMDDDEEATLATLSDYRETLAAFVERHRGRVVNTAGDSVLADFPSVVEAVQCALETQRELGARNAELADDRRMDFRIGINLGDVMAKDGDLFGEGVNIAARLEQLAAPGGICVSGSVYEQVHNKLKIAFDFLGPKSVKNVSVKIPVYRLETGVERPAEAADVSVSESTPDAASEPGTDRSSRRRRRKRRSDPEPADPEARARRQVARIARFYRHLTWYAVLVGLLFMINLLTSMSYWWFIWPALALGVPLALHALRTFGFTGRRFGPEWQDRKTRELRSRIEKDERAARNRAPGSG